MRGLDPRIHLLRKKVFAKRWIAGSSPAMTMNRSVPTELPASLWLRSTSSMRAAASLQVDVDVLLAREAQQFLDPFLAPDAGLLVAAEGGAEKMLRHFVDPHEARLDRRCRAMRGREIVRPDRAGQPVLHLIDLRQHLILVAPFEDGENRAEDLLLGDAHVHGHIGEHGRLDIEPLGEMGIARPLAASDETSAVLLAG